MDSTTENPAISAELLELLRCPVTKQRLRLAPPEVVAVRGEGLVREDEHMFYPIRNGIPVLLPDSGIEL